MKVAIFSRDLGPVGYLRLLDPLRFIGYDVQYAFAEVAPGVVTIRPGVLEWADILVVQRDFPGPDLNLICSKILASNKPVVYETDDIVWEFKSESAKRARPCILKFISAANLVTVSTENLAELIEEFNRNTVVLPNYLNHRLWIQHLINPRNRRSRRIKVGYVGGSDHSVDINDLCPVLLALLERHPNVDLCFMGCKLSSIEHNPRVFNVEENYDYERFPKNLANLKLDIGLAPLRDTVLNRCRSPIKFFDYSLVGAACIASGNSIYESVIKNGENGFLCLSLTEWFDALNKLIENAALRKAIAAKAQEDVLGNWMLADHANLWEMAYGKIAGPRTKLI